MYIRKFENLDADEVSRLIVRTIWQTNVKDYTKEYLDEFEKLFEKDKILQRASKNNYYVVIDEENHNIVGCGAIGLLDDVDEHLCLYNIFIEPNCQQNGIGKKLIGVLENDDLTKTAKKIFVYSSITAKDFYRKLGYDFVDGYEKLNEKEQNYFMVKNINL